MENFSELVFKFIQNGQEQVPHHPSNNESLKKNVNMIMNTEIEFEVDDSKQLPEWDNYKSKHGKRENKDDKIAVYPNESKRLKLLQNSQELFQQFLELQKEEKEMNISLTERRDHVTKLEVLVEHAEACLEQNILLSNRLERSITNFVEREFNRLKKDIEGLKLARSAFEENSKQELEKLQLESKSMQEKQLKNEIQILLTEIEIQEMKKLDEEVKKRAEDFNGKVKTINEDRETQKRKDEEKAGIVQTTINDLEAMIKSFKEVLQNGTD